LRKMILDKKKVIIDATAIIIGIVLGYALITGFIQLSGGKCQHEWEVKESRVLESGFEQLDKAGYAPTTLFRDKLFMKTSITIMVCKKCGKIDKTIVTK